MENQIKYLESKVQFYLHAQINCHPSMKPFYQGQYLDYVKLLNDTKNEKRK